MMTSENRTPRLARAMLLGFVCVFGLAAAHVLLESLGLWSRLPATLTRGVGLATGLVLLATLIAHLALATGPLAAPPGDETRER